MRPRGVISSRLIVIREAGTKPPVYLPAALTCFYQTLLFSEGKRLCCVEENSRALYRPLNWIKTPQRGVK
jgi:hypothetical protein